MSRRFDYVKYDEEAQKHQEAIKNAFSAIEEMIDGRIKEGRAKALVMTHLEIAYMWVGKALRDDVIGRTPVTSDLPERSNN